MVSLGNLVAEISLVRRNCYFTSLLYYLCFYMALTLLKSDAVALGVFERKTICKIFDSVDVCEDTGMSERKKTWTWSNALTSSDSAGSVVSIGGTDCFNEMRELARIKLFLVWKDQIDRIISAFFVFNWRRRVQSRDNWKEMLRQFEIRHTRF